MSDETGYDPSRHILVHLMGDGIDDGYRGDGALTHMSAHFGVPRVGDFISATWRKRNRKRGNSGLFVVTKVVWSDMLGPTVWCEAVADEVQQ